MSSQRTDEWYRKKLGKVTASEFRRLRTPGGRASYARRIRDELDKLKILEAGGEIELGPDFSAAATDWGIIQEPRARATWEFRHEVDLVQVDFVQHPRFPFVGCSPDGLTPDGRGGAEFKCPYNERVHLDTLVAGKMPAEHVPQTQGQIWICGLEWVDFGSFDPRREPSRQYFETRIHRDERYIQQLARDVFDFWDFVLSGKEREPEIVSGELPIIF